MSALLHTGEAPAGVDGWGRRRLLLTVVGTLLAGLALLVGLGYATYLALTGPATDTTQALVRDSDPDTGPALTRRDGIAAASMLAVTARDALPAAPAAAETQTIVLPPALDSGPGDVLTGFPRTPEGAVAQLAAIETTVFQAMSIPLTLDVHQHWTLPPQNPAPAGAPTPSGVAATAGPDTDGTQAPGQAGAAGWEITRHVQSFLGAAQMGPEKDLTTTIWVTPAAGLVKGTDGPDWVVACVLLEVRAVITVEARTAYGHCERMQWHDGRWLIAPGTPPAPAPSTWPGTQRSIDAGWRTWVDADPADADVATNDLSGDAPFTDLSFDLDVDVDLDPGADPGFDPGSDAVPSLAPRLGP